MLLHCCALCAPGLIRTENQDNIYINGVYRDDAADNSVFRYRDEAVSHGLYAIADGMGGERHGEIAALVTVRMLNGLTHFNGCPDLGQYILERNADICDLISRHNGVRIGSTFTGLYMNGETAYISNIGDSRLYLLRGGILTQLSHDHTFVQQKIELGVISKAAARLHPERHKLTQHLGIFPSEMIIEPYSTHIKIQANDLFLLCSDGLTDMLDDSEIENMLASPDATAQKTEALYTAAMKNGGKDNISILLVHIKGDGGV